MTTPEMSHQSAGLDGLGEQFAKLMHEATEGRLGRVSWFRTDWQRGGARTGRSTFAENENEEPCDVVVKIPVGPRELEWNQRLQCNAGDRCEVSGRLFAWGQRLGDYDLAWIVMERFCEGPLFGLKRSDGIELMADAAARFYVLSSKYPAEGDVKCEDWSAIISQARDHLSTNVIDDTQRWNQLLKIVQKNLDAWVAQWKERQPTQWIHGDLSPANAMSRSNEAKDPAMLIDFAEVRPGHWLEDAIYLERLYWLKPERYQKSPPVTLIGQRRTHYGLNNGANIKRLADIRRVLLSATAPAFLKTEGTPTFLKATLNQLEAAIERLK